MGRFYLSAVCVGAVLGCYLAAIHQQLQDKLWVFGLATVWLITGGMALAAVLNGNIETHRQWMTRNYAFTAVFVTARILNLFPIPDRYGNAPGWMLLLGTLLFTEIGLSWRSIFTNRGPQSVSARSVSA